MERISSTNSNGLVEKYLAWDQKQGDQSNTARKAHQIYIERMKANMSGTALEDWQKAEKTIREEFERDMASQLA